MDQPTPDEPRICPQCGTANTPDAAAANAYCCIQCGLELAHVDTMPTGGVRGMFGWLKQAGDVVGDRYVVRGVLGKGGFGATYLADDRRVQGKRWALKEIPELLFDEHEVALLGKLDHPAIPAIGDCFAENGMKYLALEFGGNRSLRHECRTHGRIPYDTLKPWAVQLAQALQYLHGQVPPVVHRDMKPDNVLLDENDRVMLIDFGIATESACGMRRTLGRAASDGFSPPEQVLGSGTGTDQRSDIYSFAATLYFALTGQIPTAAHERVAGKPLSPPAEFVPDLPATVNAILMQALTLNSNDRPQRIKEMLAVLEEKPQATVETWMSSKTVRLDETAFDSAPDSGRHLPQPLQNVPRAKTHTTWDSARQLANRSLWAGAAFTVIVVSGIGLYALRNGEGNGIVPVDTQESTARLPAEPPLAPIDPTPPVVTTPAPTVAAESPPLPPLPVRPKKPINHLELWGLTGAADFFKGGMFRGELPTMVSPVPMAIPQNYQRPIQPPSPLPNPGYNSMPMGR